jgi:RluA family pseudouridine synthase
MKDFIVAEDDVNMRLDRWLRKKLPLTPLAGIFRLLRKGKARINKKKKPEDYRLILGDVISVDAPDAEFDAGRITAAPSSLVKTSYFSRNFNVLFEDENFLVCQKPSGIVVHSGTGHTDRDSLVDLASAYLSSRKGKHAEALLVHRLDRDTSGVILLAKNKITLRTLNEELRDGEMAKEYLCICHGRLPMRSGTVDVPLVKNYEGDDGTKMRVGHGGVRSISHYRVIKERGTVSYVAVELVTGRTHQIRVHMEHLKCPIIGDVRYGDATKDKEFFKSHATAPKRLYLHARRISLNYPGTNKPVSFEAPEPKEFLALWESL